MAGINIEYHQLVKNLLTHVGKHGWSPAALELAAHDCDIDPALARLHFNHDLGQIMSAYSNYLDDIMLAAAPDLSQMKIRDKVASLLIARFSAMNEHKTAAIGASKYLTLHCALATKLVAKTVDKIWYAAGDNATDFNYYTKRALLAGVYTSTLAYWQNDTSDDFTDTKEFIARRIDNVMKINKIKAFFQRLKLD